MQGEAGCAVQGLSRCPLGSRRCGPRAVQTRTHHSFVLHCGPPLGHTGLASMDSTVVISEAVCTAWGPALGPKLCCHPESLHNVILELELCK